MEFTGWLEHWLAENVIARIFLIVSLGFLLGEVRWPGNFRLGVAAVLFVGLAFGVWSSKMQLPEEIQMLGLVLFVYCIGLQAAPGFFQSLKTDGLRLNAAMFLAILTAAAVCWAAIRLTGRSPELLIGVFCGGLTNTPALGAATQALAKSGTTPEQINTAVVGYGLAYPIAIVVVLLLMQLRLGRGTAPQTPVHEMRNMPPALTLSVENLGPGNLPWTVETLSKATGLVITRCQAPGAAVSLAAPDTALPPGSRFVAVGAAEQLRAGIEAAGHISSIRLQDEMKGFELRRYFVSNPEIVGRPLRELDLGKMGAIVSRLRRGDVDLPVNDQTVLHLGDRVRVLSYRDKEPLVRSFFGNSVTASTETGYFSFGVGILLGLILGYLPWPVPGLGGSVKLGLAGGPLIVALIVGSLGRTGPFIWNLPLEVNLTLRNLGLLFFLAAVGVKAGSGLIPVFRAEGLFLTVFAFLFVALTHLLLWLLLRLAGRSQIPVLFGVMSGLQTQPAALTFAATRADPGMVNTSYASVYPLALVQKVILAQLLVALL